MIRLVAEDGREIDPYSEEGLNHLAELWSKVACEHRMMYKPTWLGIPIIQYSEDIIMGQELIWKLRPDVIVETGVAHGGSAILYASLLELIGHGRVIGVDVEIRHYNRAAIQSHPLSSRIELIEGSSIDPAIVEEVKKRVVNNRRVLVMLDSNHSYDHVLAEMEIYESLVQPGGYMVVMDGAQRLMADIPRGKPEWREDNPWRAIHDFLKTHPEWEIDPHYNRMLVTSNPDGFLRRRMAE